MSKRLFAIILLMACKYGYSQDSSAITFNITYVSFKVYTRARVPCERFEITFPKRNLWKPENQRQTDSLIMLVHDFTPFSWPNIDVRAVIEWKSNGKNVYYCFDQFGVFADGNKNYKNTALFDFLKRHIPFDR